MRVAIIGAGAAGSATARFLAMAGVQVDIFEQFHMDHDRGSSHGPSRVIRRIYPDLLYTALMGEAYRLWDQLEEEYGVELRVRTGGIYFGPSEHPSIMNSLDALDRAGADYERLDPEQAHRRFPAFRFRDHETVVYQEDMGLLRASECVRAQLGLARERGANLKEMRRVLGVRPDGAGYEVVTDEGTMGGYDRVVVAAGPWVTQLVTGVPLPLSVTRQQVLFIEPRGDHSLFASGHFPVWIDAETEVYGMPMHEDAQGAKVASNQPGEIVSPDRVPQEMETAHLELMRDYLAERLPDLGFELAFTKVCLYTMAPDHDFVLDEAPGSPGLFVLSACSGHGFKFSILMGSLVAAMVRGQELPAELARFRLSRFAF